MSNDNTNTNTSVSVESVNEIAAWKYAVNSQGFTGTFEDWMSQSEEERAEYELGAEGV